MSVRIAIQYKT